MATIKKVTLPGGSTYDIATAKALDFKTGKTFDGSAAVDVYVSDLKLSADTNKGKILISDPTDNHVAPMASNVTSTGKVSIGTTTAPEDADVGFLSFYSIGTYGDVRIKGIGGLDATTYTSGGSPQLRFDRRVNPSTKKGADGTFAVIINDAPYYDASDVLQSPSNRIGFIQRSYEEKTVDNKKVIKPKFDVRYELPDVDNTITEGKAYKILTSRNCYTATEKTAFQTALGISLGNYVLKSGDTMTSTLGINAQNNGVGLYVTAGTHNMVVAQALEIGTASKEGVAAVDIGNAIATGSADNARGCIRMYDEGSHYHVIKPAGGLTSGNPIHYLPNSNGFLVTATNASATGSASKPVYINGSGVATQVTSIDKSLISGFVKTSGDTMTGNLIVSNAEKISSSDGKTGAIVSASTGTIYSATGDAKNVLITIGDGSGANATMGGSISLSSLGRQYLKLGVGTFGVAGTVGTALLTLGNGEVKANDNNAKGLIRMYDEGANYHGITTRGVLTKSITQYLPLGTESGHIVGTETTSAVGSVNRPVYITSNGIAKTTVGIYSGTALPTSGTYVNGDVFLVY